MDNIGTIIIIIFIVLSFFGKKKKAADAKKAGQKKKPGLLDSLGNLKAMLEEAAESHKAKTEPAGDAGRKGRAIPASELFREKREAPDLDLDMFAEDLDALPDFVEDVVPPAPPVRRRPSIRKAPEVKAPPSRPARPEGEKKPLLDTGFELNELQKAIVWSEIIGPPVALKQNKT